MTTRSFNLSHIENFEFPGTATELGKFHEKFEVVQAAEANRYTQVISIDKNLWARMDLQSRAGLMIHEALRLIYIRSVKSYLVPGILQWMTGIIMLHTPDYPATQRLIESFYEELVVTTDNTAVADRLRPEAWRNQLCQHRHELAKDINSIIEEADFIKSENSQEALTKLCALHQDALQASRSRNPWMNLGFNVAMLVSPCDVQDLKDLPTYTLTYWMQKSLGIDQTWLAPQQPQTAFDIVFILANHPSTLNTANYKVLLNKFIERGEKYCTKRNDYYGSGQEFLALGDILLETLIKTSKK